MGATLTVLGAGSILPRVGYGCSGYALRARPGGAVTLLDCGPGSVRRLAEAGIALGEVERVVLSHFHLDHCLDVFALAFARHNPNAGALPELELVGPVGLARWLAAAPEALGRWATFPGARVVEVPLVGDRGHHQSAALAFTCAANGHTQDAVSWRVEGPDVSLTYSGDAPEDRRVSELARGSTVFLCEASFPDGEATDNHLTPRGAARLAAAAGVQRLVLTHFYPSLAPQQAVAEAGELFGGPIEAARDGLVIDL
jgi:ribonuclease BN (tRNA processing enzyme)